LKIRNFGLLSWLLDAFDNYNMGLRELKKLRLAEHVAGARFRTKRPSKGPPADIQNSRSGKLGLECRSHAKPAAW